MTEDVSDILTVKQAAAILALSEQTVRILAKRGELPARKIGGVWRFHRASLIDFVGPASMAAAPTTEVGQ